MITVLLAEDDLYLHQLLKQRLEKEGFHILSCFQGAQALAFFQSKKIDLVITDIMMPLIDGNELVFQIKQKNPDIPVLVLTALEQFEDKKKSFTLGADDYLTKPVQMEELFLRMQALLRRYHRVQLKNIVHKEIEIQYDKKILYIEQVPIELTKKEFHILYMLFSFPDRIYSRLQILDEVWGQESESFERTVDVHINKLREKLQKSSADIVTVRGLGYKGVFR